MTNGQVSTRDHLVALFAAFKEQVISEQKLRDAKFDDFKAQLDKDGKRLAEEYKSDLAAYPSIHDFNKLQNQVTIEFASAVGRAKAVAIGMGLLGVAVSLIVGALAIWK